MAQIHFPSEKQVRQEVEVVQQVQRIKKNSFMDAVNMNKFARDMRPELLSVKAQKIRFWIDDVDVKVKRRLEDRIKIIPTIEHVRALTPTKISVQTIKQNPNMLEQPEFDGNSGYGLDDEEIVMTEKYSEIDGDKVQLRSIQNQVEQERVLQVQAEDKSSNLVSFSKGKLNFTAKQNKSMREITLQQADDQQVTIDLQKSEKSLFDPQAKN